MKTIIALTVLLSVLTSIAFSSNYEEAMKTNILKINESKNAADFTTLANQFERIANAENDKWLPGYYAAFCYTWATTVGEMPADDKHKLLDLAQAQIDVLMKSNKTETEIFALQAFIYQLRITDMTKGMKYSVLSNESLDEAERLNPNNPRVYYMRGTNTFYTPKSFGGGKEKAKPLFEKAAVLFDSQMPANELLPNWGKEHNSQMLKQCNEGDKE